MSSYSLSWKNAATYVHPVCSGTGASAIYPLLATRFTARSEQECLGPVCMLATDVNAVSLAHARRLVDRNGLSDEIQLFQVDQGGQIFPSDVTQAAET